MKRLPLSLILAAGIGFAPCTNAAEKTAVERGREAVRGRPALNPGTWSMKGYDNVWRQWGLKEKPADHAAAFRERYGVHTAPYENGGLPMGLHDVGSKRIATDCLLCHASTIAGQTVMGLANSALDIQGIFDELSAEDRLPFTLPFKVGNARGTVDPISPVVFLMGFRDADLNVGAPIDLGRTKPLASDPPAWWLLKKKKTRNWTGGLDTHSTRADMATLLTPLNSAEHVKKAAPVFADIHAFVLNVEAPRYPFPIDNKLAEQGRKVFTDTCARCHGTHGEKWTYPNKVVPLKAIGTDPLLGEALSKKLIDHFNKSWLGQEQDADGRPIQVTETGGYQAPPLDGVWATAPYLHNGSVPTVYHLLNSKARPKLFTRSFRTGKDDYDPVKLGWKFTEVEKAPAEGVTGVERRRVYDTSQRGLSNGGHLYGDKLTETERRAVIEYLKTL